MTSVVAATDNKIAKFQSLSRSGSVNLNDSLYDEFTSKPREHYAAIIFTATDARFGCILCREFQPEWELIAQSWSKGTKPEGLNLLFGTLDFSNGRNTFHMVLFAPKFILICAC